MPSFSFFQKINFKKSTPYFKNKTPEEERGGLNTKYTVKPQKGIKMKGRSSCLQFCGQLGIFNFSRGRERRIKYQVHRKTVKRNQNEREEFMFTVFMANLAF